MVVSLDGRLAELIDTNAPVELIATGFRFTEGPVWNSRENCLLFSDPRTHIIHRWSERDGASIFRESSNSANGNTFDPGGRLLTCESRQSLPRRPDGSFDTEGQDPMGGRQVTRTSTDGKIEAIATHYRGGRLSGPNDILCLANGDVLFTDPNFGLRHGDGTMTPRETPFNGVYRIDHANGSVEVVTGNVETPNGLVVTDDCSQVLIADTRHHVVRSYPLGGDATGKGNVHVDLTHGESLGHPDGMKLDSRGNLYIAAGTAEGIWVYGTDRSLFGFVPIPERPANCAWGDTDWQSLYVTAQSSVYRVRFKVPGQKLNPGDS
jgi:gluconolactonase